jgi:arabinogalactan endo-1,4-beta-galactosidase
MADSFKDPVKYQPPTALIKISKNKGQDAFYGQKYNSEVLLEDDGSTVSGFTFVEHDTERGLLFAGGEYLNLDTEYHALIMIIAGVYTPYIAVCKL